LLTKQFCLSLLISWWYTLPALVASSFVVIDIRHAHAQALDTNLSHATSFQCINCKLRSAKTLLNHGLIYESLVTKHNSPNDFDGRTDSERLDALIQHLNTKQSRGTVYLGADQEWILSKDHDFGSNSLVAEGVIHLDGEHTLIFGDGSINGISRRVDIRTILKDGKVEYESNKPQVSLRGLKYSQSINIARSSWVEIAPHGDSYSSTNAGFSYNKNVFVNTKLLTIKPRGHGYVTHNRIVGKITKLLVDLDVKGFSTVNDNNIDGTFEGKGAGILMRGAVSSNSVTGRFESVNGSDGIVLTSSTKNNRIEQVWDSASDTSVATDISMSVIDEGVGNVIGRSSWLKLTRIFSDMFRLSIVSRPGMELLRPFSDLFVSKNSFVKVRVVKGGGVRFNFKLVDVDRKSDITSAESLVSPQAPNLISGELSSYVNSKRIDLLVASDGILSMRVLAGNPVSSEELLLSVEVRGPK